MNFTLRTLKGIVVSVLGLRTYRTQAAMANITLMPPKEVKGMTRWDPEKFKCKIQVPYVEIKAVKFNKFQKKLAEIILKLPHLKSVEESANDPTFKRVLLNPGDVKEYGDLCEELKEVVSEKDFGTAEITVGHENYKPHNMLKAVLEGSGHDVSGFSRIGHIVHLNLRDGLESYKKVIGQILLQMPNVDSVINKTNNIDNTYRNFSMEVLAGSNNFNVSVRECGNRFEFDFSKVYWNPRLSTEHSRIVDLLERGDILLDVFAGVGPFAIPSAVKGLPTKKSPTPIKVVANDLNPESYKWLCHNVKLNKADRGHITCFNLDGKEFIETELKRELAKWYEDKNPKAKLHIVMNLPAIAIEFLGSFNGLLSDCEAVSNDMSPTVHVYAFSSSENPEDDLTQRGSSFLGHKIHNAMLHFVRNVSTNKNMYRLSFELTSSMLLGKDLEPDAKRLKIQ